VTPVLRPATPADADAICAIYAPVVTGTAASFEETPPDPEEITRRMLSSPRLPWLVAAVDGHVMGYAYASRHRSRPAYRWSADCSVYVAPALQGRGIGRLLYDRLIAEVAGLGYRSLFAGIALPNDAKRAVARGVGVCTCRRLSGSGVQAGRLARRGVVAARPR